MCEERRIHLLGRGHGRTHANFQDDMFPRGPRCLPKITVHINAPWSECVVLPIPSTLNYKQFKVYISLKVELQII